MFRKIAGIVCVIISILYFFNATHSIEDPYNHYIELFHPKGIVDVLVQGAVLDKGRDYA